MRTKQKISKAEEMLYELVWYERHQSGGRRTQKGNGGQDVASTKGAKAAKRIEAKYPGRLGPHTDFEWGMLNGKLSALRWVLGDQWDQLDT